MQDTFDTIFNGAEPEQQETQIVEPVTEEQIAPETIEADEPVVEDQGQEALDTETTEDETKRSKRDHPIPLPTFLDMRDRAKAAEAAQKQAALEAEGLRQQLEALRNPVSEVQAPDPVNDPQGFRGLLEQRIAEAVFNERMMNSHARARVAHDAETVDQAIEWATARTTNDAAFDQLVQRQADPMEWVIQQHKAAKAIEDFQRDPDEFVRRRAAELGLGQTAVAKAAVTPQQQKAEKELPRSITSIPATNGQRATSRGSDGDFDAIFG